MTLTAETKLDSRLERDQLSSCPKSPVSSGWSLDVILEGDAGRACSRSDSPDSAPRDCRLTLGFSWVLQPPTKPVHTS